MAFGNLEKQLIDSAYKNPPDFAAMEKALEAGADLVMELPVAAAVSDASTTFAR